MMIVITTMANIERKKIAALWAFKWATLLIQSCFIFHLHIDGFWGLDVDSDY